MTEIKLVDVTVHIDKDTDTAIRGKLETTLRGIDGVVSVHMPEQEPHLVVIEYNPDKVKSRDILDSVEEIAGQAELIGL